MDVANLGMRVDSSQLRSAKRDLIAFAREAVRAGADSKRLDLSSAALARTIGTKLVGALGAVGAGVASFAALNRASEAAAQFGTAIAEVSTLIEGTPAQMAKLREESKRLSSTYGGSATRNAKAFYQAISAGASSVEEASAIIDQANKLAVGGVTDVFTATDGLTSVMNAYSESGITAAEISDSMFVAMKAGKTTIGELSSSLGRIAPFASAAGVTFDELTASIAAVTSKGINTKEAVTGIRQALVSISKPSAQAVELAGQLGLEFDSTALSTKGLQGFMQSLADATDGSVEKLTVLLGSADAANAVLALLAGNGAKFNEVLTQQEQKLGSTDAAYTKMATNLENRMAVAMATIENVGLGPGSVWYRLKLFAAETGADVAGAIDKMAKDVKSIISGDWASTWSLAEKIVKASSVGIMQKAVDISIGIGKAFADAFKEMREEALASSATTKQAMADGVNAGLLDLQRTLEQARVSANEFYTSFNDNAWSAAEAAGQVSESLEKIIPGFKMNGSLVDSMNDSASGTSDELDEATASANSLNAALSGASNSASRLESQSAKISNWLSQPINSGGQWGRGRINIGYYVPDKRPLKDYFDFVDGEVGNLDKEIKDFVKSNNGAINDAIMAGGSDPRDFWNRFREAAIDNYGGIIEQLFAADGAATNAINGTLQNILNGYVSQVNAQISQLNTKIDNRKPFDNIRRGNFGSLIIDTDKYKNWENNFTKYDFAGAALKGQLGGRDGGRSWVDLITKITKTTGVKVDDSGVNTGVNDPVNGDDILKGMDFDNGLNLDFGDLTINTDLLDGKMLTIDDVNGPRTTTIKESKRLKSLSKLFGNIVGDIQDRVRIFGDVIGGRVDGMGKILHRFNVSLGKDGKMSSKTSKLLIAEFDDYSDRLARRVLKGRNDLKNAGESWTDALERLSKDFLGVTQNMLLIGQDQLQKASLNNAKMASEIAAAFGGVEEFGEAAASYFSVAFSQSEQKDQLEDYVRSILEDAGISNMPTTREQYRNKVERALERGNTENYSLLVGMADLFDQILPPWEEGVAGVEDVSSRLGKATSFATRRLSEMIAEASSTGSQFERLAKSLKDVAQNIRGMGRSTDQNFEYLEERFDSLFNRASKGRLGAMSKIGGVAKDYANALAAQSSTAAEYRFQTAVIANKLDAISKEALEQSKLSYFEAESLQNLKDAVEEGKLNNKLVRKTNNIVGGFGNKMVKSLAAIYESQTGKKLKFAENNTANDPKKSSRDGPNSGDGSGSSDGSSGSQKSSSETEMSKLRDDLKKWREKSLRISRRNHRQNRRTARILADFDSNGLPPERS